MIVTQEVRNGVNRVQLHLDPERKAEPFAGIPVLQTLRARAGEAPRLETIPLTWSGPDTLVAEVLLEGEETALSTVSIPGQKPQSLPPVSLPYSPEYAPSPLGSGDDRGRSALERLARSTGGIERLELAAIWTDMPRRPRSFPLAPWLLLAAVVCLLLEVLERRTALVSSAFRAVRSASFRFRFTRKPVAATSTATTPTTAPSEVPTKTSKPATAPKKTEPAPQAAEPKGGLLDAMKKVRGRKRGDG
jgi:hypothetical protein